LGTCGEVDVHDCGELVKLALSKYSNLIDEKRVGVYGGSHGGYLTGMLIGSPTYGHLF
jgi:dipeptidyl aminopeptidase/acylaminoacyl peptidase